MYSIGEFSKVTGLTIKTLRFYHEQGLLEPSYVEPGSGYRYYAREKVDAARAIASLRELEFSLADIKSMMSTYADDSDVVAFFESQKSRIQERLRKDRQLVRRLDGVILHEREVRQAMNENSYQVEEKQVDPILVASIRMTGDYSDCGKGFGRIGRYFGRFICGKAMMLCHDTEYREGDANFEVAMPIKKGEPTEDIDVRELPGGHCLSLMHLGAYDELKRSYAKLMEYARERELDYAAPSREIYHKGPGMIFRGDPKRYLTEIQLMITNAQSDSEVADAV